MRTAALAGGKAYWRYLDAYFDSGKTDEATLSDLRWDAYLGPAYGYTGHTWFIYQIDAGNTMLEPLLFAQKGGFSTAPTSAFAEVAALNQELERLMQSVVLLRSIDVRYAAVIGLLQPRGTTAWARGAGGDPFLSGVELTGGKDALLGFFRDDCDEPYLLVQNLAHAAGDFPNGSDGPATLRLGFDFAGATDPALDRAAVQVLDPATAAGVATWPLTSTGATTATLDLTLRAGAGVLLKYKTAQPFARQ